MASSSSSSEKKRPTVAELLSQPREEIVAVLGRIYEHSSWVAERLVDHQRAVGTASLPPPIHTVSELASTMKNLVDNSSHEQKLQLLCAHPDLCEKVGTLATLTPESQTEQGRAGLQSMTSDELDCFTRHNELYRTKFGFPFILAVRNATKHTVLAALEGRVHHPPEREFAIALEQVHKIAWMRLLAALDLKDAQGFLTCHVLDTANGCPGACNACAVVCVPWVRVFNADDRSSLTFVLAWCLSCPVLHAANKMRLQLHRLSPPEQAGLVGEYITNDDGRLSTGPALRGGSQFLVGTYEWTFYVADYFASKGTLTSGTPFLDVVPLRFGIDNPDDHYHVPLLVSPWSFSTYRGS